MKRLRGQPFALIGVNSDRNRKKLKQTIKRENLSWRSFWDGGSTSGPIAQRWNVEAWPTYYILDARGVIRAIDQQGPTLDRIVDALVKEAKAK